VADSEVAVCNIALQKLGQPAIVSLDDNSVAARECNRCYAHVRNTLTTSHRWGFAMRQATLAAEAAAPDFTYGYAFPWPTDCLRPLPPTRNDLEWRMSGRKILTSDGATLELEYIAKVTDTSLFPDTFTEALAVKLALQMCEKMTQSNTKKDSLKDELKAALADAKKANDFAEISAEPPEDTWLSAMR